MSATRLGPQFMIRPDIYWFTAISYAQVRASVNVKADIHWLTAEFVCRQHLKLSLGPLFNVKA